ncbi:MAG: hypothetical protein ACREBU_20520, partial [Nitrososphaera sp.]
LKLLHAGRSTLNVGSAISLARFYVLPIMLQKCQELVKFIKFVVIAQEQQQLSELALSEPFIRLQTRYNIG